MTRSINGEKLYGRYCRTSSQVNTNPCITPRIVLVFGVFDLFHPGHRYFLQQAKKHGDKLIVVVTRDERVKREKGRLPVEKLARRIESVNRLDCVHATIPGDKIGEWSVVQRMKPDVICIGHDQQEDHPNFLRQIDDLQSKPRIVKIMPYKRDKYSTTLIRLTHPDQ
jgi:FAD synthetase